MRVFRPLAACLSVCSESPAVRSSVPLPVVLCEKSRSCFPLQPPSLVLQRLSHPRGGGSFGSFQWSYRSILQRGGVSGTDCAGVGGQSWSRLASLAGTGRRTDHPCDGLKIHLCILFHHVLGCGPCKRFCHPSADSIAEFRNKEARFFNN